MTYHTLRQCVDHVAAAVLAASSLLGPAALPAGAEGKPAPDGPSQHALAVQFLKDHLIGKTLELPVDTVKLAGGKVETVYTVRRTYQNLTDSKLNFSYEVVRDIHQTNYDLDEQGKRAGKGFNKDGRTTLRYQLGERASTGRLIGISWLVSTDREDVPFGASAIQVKCEDGKLIYTTSTVLYNDHIAPGDAKSPGADEGRSVFAVIDGKVECRIKGRNFSVNPDTLERTLTEDFPEVIMKQAD